MKQCYYDNPAFMRREVWRDGKCFGSITHELMCTKNPHFKIQHLLTPPFKAVGIHGDPEAMSISVSGEATQCAE